MVAVSSPTGGSTPKPATLFAFPHVNMKWSNAQIAEKTSLKIALYTVTCVGLLSAKNAEN